MVHNFPFIITRLKINLMTETEIGFYTDGMPLQHTKNSRLPPSHPAARQAAALPPVGTFGETIRTCACARKVKCSGASAARERAANHKNGLGALLPARLSAIAPACLFFVSHEFRLVFLPLNGNLKLISFFLPFPFSNSFLSFKTS